MGSNNDDLGTNDLHSEEVAHMQGSAALAVGLPLLTAGVAIVCGLVLGALGAWIVMHGPPEKVEVPRDLTSAELSLACAPLIEKAMSDLDAAETKVQDLETRVSSKQKEVEELEAEMNRRAKSGQNLVAERNALRAELEAKKAELVTLTKRLDLAVQEKEILQQELTQTKEDLVEQKYQTHTAKEDALTYKWSDFVAGSQLEGCDKGNRKKLGRCRETIDEMLSGAYKDRFDHCVRSGQAVPSVHELPKGEAMPKYAEYINQDDRITRDWYVLLCDPTLPEAADPYTMPSRTQPTKSSGDLLGDFNDLPD